MDTIAALGKTPVLAGHIADPRSLPAETVQAWTGCLSRQALPTPFLGPTFSRAVAACHGNVRVLVLKDAGTPVAFFPYQYASPLKAWLGAGERVGGEMSDYAGIVADAPVRVDPSALLKLAGLSSFSFSHLPAAQRSFGLEGSEPRIGPIVELSGGLTEYWAALQARNLKLIRDTERSQRRLAGEVGPLRFTFDQAYDAAQLDRLIAAKREQYAKTNVGDALMAPWKRALLHDLARQQEADCTGLFSTLYAGDTWAAMHFGIKSRSVLHYWFPVYNADLAKYSPGRLLLVSLINAAFETGIRTIDMGEGDSPAKRDFATGQVELLKGRWERAGLRSLLDRVADGVARRLGTS